MILLKDEAEITRMHAAGQVVAAALTAASRVCVPGATTGMVCRAIEQTYRDHDAVPLMAAEEGFPAAASVSVNDEVMGGIPGNRRLQSGDVVSVDTSCRLRGWCCDAARTFPAGDIDRNTTRLLQCGIAVLQRAIDALSVSNTWSNVAAAMQAEADKLGFALANACVGHGIGRALHEDPQLPIEGSSGADADTLELKPGLILAIEPVFTMGNSNLHHDANGWTQRTVDGTVSVHFEDTIALTADGAAVLTQ